MYLEKLEIQGFKSFANKNKLIFPGGLSLDGKHGLTAIVGPNGSGKSNIADAVRWVLGEQSLKTLRGKKSEDVIFSGSDKKNQLGMAEVSLYLNNTNKNQVKANSEEMGLVNNLDANGNSLSPLDYDEIIITRRLYRNGDSEYLLNNNRVRLSDIQILLAKANVGQKTYSVIGQGMVESFLNTGAGERKEFFDEATGVKQFQIKRDQALNKLESSFTNLQQVEMLLSEIKPRLKMLTRQVDKLAKRGQLEAELKTWQLNYYSSLWQEISAKINNNKSELSLLHQEKQTREKELIPVQAELELIKNTNKKDDNKRGEMIRAAQEEKSTVIRSIARLNAEIELQLEAQGQFDAAWLNKRIDELKSEKKQLENEVTSLENSGLEDTIKNNREKLKALENEINIKNEILRQSKDLSDEHNRLLKQIDRLDAFLEASLENKGHYDISWLNNKKTELQKNIESINNELKIFDLENLSEELRATTEKRSVLSKEIDRKNFDLQKINQELKSQSKPSANREEINRSIDSFLEKLDEIKKENDPSKIKAIITAAKLEFKQQISQLIDGEISEKLEKVKMLQTDIIKNSELREDLSREINEQQIELSTKTEKKNLLLSRLKDLSYELLSIEEKIKKSQSFRDEDSIKQDKEIVFEKIEKIEAEIKELEKEADTKMLLTKQEELKEEYHNNLLQLSVLKDRLNHYQERLKANNKENQEVLDKIAKGQKSINIEAVKLAKNELENSLALVEKNLSLWQEEERKEQLNSQKERSRFFACQEKIQQLQTKVNQIINKINTFQIELTRQETRQEDLVNNITEDDLDILEIKNYINESEIEVNETDLRSKINQLKNNLELIGGIDPEAEKEYNETSERFTFLDKQTKDLNAAINSLEKVISELDENIKTRFDKEFKLIAEKFSEYFKILFNGGQAKIFKLDLEADEDNKENKDEIDEKSLRIKKLKKYNALKLSGIEIQATPPGKKIQSISMLSGGERALTAIALICAIISSNPSPFVMLDEVDAALDESNSERLAKILEDLSSKTQFISITHNRASMKKASIIYGVTMKSDGVSQLLSIRLDEIAAFKD